MRLIQFLINMVEESSPVDSNLNTCINGVIMQQCMADKLWTPFKIIVFNPLNTLIVTSCLYVIFCAIYLPLFLISLLLTPFGALFIFVGLIIQGLRSVARSIIFAGSSQTVQKDVAQEFLRKLVNQIENISMMSTNIAASLLVICSGQIRLEDAQFDSKLIHSLLSFSESFKKVSKWLTKCKSLLEKSLVPDDLDNLAQLIESLSDLTISITSLQPYLSQFHIRGYTLPIHEEKLKTAVLQCLNASEALKTICPSIRPKKKEDSNFLSIFLHLCSYRSGPAGLEQVSFMLMREQLQSVFGAEFVSIPGSNRNIIDAVIIPSADRFHALKQSPPMDSTTTGTTTSASPSPSLTATDTVLFCNPNAGFYECLSQAQKDSSWLGFYTQLGFDVCLFNYRGYGRSTGTPTPDAVKMDGETVAKYLREVRGVPRLVVHGESIGGMVACHLAAHTRVDLLVADRAFASLHSLAGRLLGRWAEHGLTYLTRWNTNVVADFKTATCPKVVLQDPNDEIIIDGASLKAGVASMRVLGDRAWHRRKVARIYAIADALENPTPAQNADRYLETAKTLTGSSLNEDLLHHMYGCIMEVARRAGLSGKKGAAAATDSEDEDGGSGEYSMESSGKTKDIYGSITDSSSRNGHGYSSMPSSDGSEGKRTDVEGGVELTQLSDHGIGVRPPSQSIHRHRSRSGLKSLQSSCSSAEEWLHLFCSLNVVEPSNKLTAFERIWVALARTDGGSGELLGQAVSKGYDGLRNWVCCLLVWSSRTSPDLILPRGRTDVKKTVTNIREIMSNSLIEGLSADKSLEFICRALEVVGDKQDKIQQQTEAVEVSLQLQDIGHLIPLHCGHNGWPGSVASGALIRILNLANFKINPASSNTNSRTMLRQTK